LKKLHRSAAFILAALWAAFPAVAEEGGWRLRLFGFYMGTGDQPTVTDDAGTILTTDNDAGAGIGLDAQYSLNGRLGLELGLALADHGDFRPAVALPGAVVDATDTMSVSMLSVGVNYNLTPSAAVDVYVGAVVALVDYDSFSISYDPSGVLPAGSPSNVRVDVDDDVGLGLQLGVDLPLDEEHWILHAKLRYLKSSMDGTGSGAAMPSVDYDPLVIGLGFGYRF
jgi:outer membrane protein